MVDLKQALFCICSPLYSEIVSEADLNKVKISQIFSFNLDETESRIFFIMLTFYVYGVLVHMTVFMTSKKQQRNVCILIQFKMQQRVIEDIFLLVIH